MTMALVGECRGWDVETELLSHWNEHRDLFPRLPSQSGFSRRRRNLASSFNLIRLCILRCLEVAQDRHCLIGSLPIPVAHLDLVPGSTGDWRAYGARFGKVPSKKQTIFGYKLHLLITLGGVILDFELAPANASDLEVGFELLMEQTDSRIMGSSRLSFIGTGNRADGSADSDVGIAPFAHPILSRTSANRTRSIRTPAAREGTAGTAVQPLP